MFLKENMQKEEASAIIGYDIHIYIKYAQQIIFQVE